MGPFGRKAGKGKENGKGAEAGEDRARKRAARHAALADAGKPAFRDGPGGNLDYWIALAGVSSSAKWR
jgi:hypothetical protein